MSMSKTINMSRINKINFLKPKNFFVNFSNKNFISLNPLKAKSSDDSNLLNKGAVKISYYSKIQVCKEAYVFRFLLPESDSLVGHKICQYINLEATMPNGEILRRPFNPISLDTDKGFIDIMVKIYAKDVENKNYGMFSNFLSILEEGQVVTMTGPQGHIKYDSHGQFSLYQENKIKKVNKIGMIAGGTGITPMFQLIQKIISTKDKTGISLIYCTKFIEDIAFCEDLVNYDRTGKLSFYPVVETPNASKWFYGKGKVTEEIIENYMPSPKDDNSVIFLCGPNPMIENHLKPMLRSMRYNEENILSFH